MGGGEGLMAVTFGRKPILRNITGNKMKKIRLLLTIREQMYLRKQMLVETM